MSARPAASLLAATIVLSPVAWAQRVVPAWDRAVDLSRNPNPAKSQPPSQAIRYPSLQVIRSGEFVRREGSTLLLNNRPFRFAGNNTYYLQAEIAYRRGFTVEETLDKMAELGLSVTRANAHNDHPPAQDPAAIQTDPGVFVESSLVALDQSIAEAKRRNIRLILKLTNNWEAYGGIRRYVTWRLGRAPTPAEYPLFYTDSTVRKWFQDYVRTILERRNTITGIAYKDEPAIVAWELGNELRNPAPGNADALIAWMTEMSAFIKGIDPNHLVSDGGEGFDDDASLYLGLSNRYPVAGREGCSFHRMVQIPDIDLASYHLYPADWGLNDAADTSIWIKRHEEIARAAGKVAFLGEYGRRANNQSPPACSAVPGREFDPERARIFAAWLAENTMQQGSAGHMAWQLIDDGRNDCEGFQIYCPRDAATCALLRGYAETANAAPLVVTSSASFRPHRVAPDFYASMFGTNELAGGAPSPAQILIADSTGAERVAEILYAGPQQLNFLIPGATASGGAVFRLLRNGEVNRTATANIHRVEPGLFSADASGRGWAAATVTTVADGSRVIRLAAEFNSETGRFVGVPIDVSAGEVVVSLYGTGLRHAESPGSAQVLVGDTALPVLFIGPQGQYPALDQINVRLPRELAGRGEIDMLVRLSNRESNAVRLLIR